MLSSCMSKFIKVLQTPDCGSQCYCASSHGSCYLGNALGTERSILSNTLPRCLLAASRRKARAASCGSYDTRDRGRTKPRLIPSLNIACRYFISSYFSCVKRDEKSVATYDLCLVMKNIPSS